MKIRLAIVDKDENYVKRLIHNLQLNYADKIEPYYFPVYDKFLSFLVNNMINVVLVSEEYKIEEGRMPEGVSFAYLVSGKDIEELYGKPAVCKFQKAELLYKNVLSLFADMEEVVLRGSKGGNRRIMFTSAQGGVGVSALAAAYAIRQAALGKSVLYLNLDTFFKTEICFQGEGAMSFSDVVYAIKSRRANLSIKLESAMKRDPRGVNFFDSCRNANDMLELNAEDMELLINTLGTMGNYDCIIMDARLDFGPVCRKLLEKYASEIILVDDGSEVGNIKFQNAMEIIKLMDQKQKGTILPKCRLLYNRFSSSQGKKLVDIPIDTVGGINRIEGAEYRQLIEKLSAHGAFEQLG